MILPEGNDAAEQIWPPKQWTIPYRRAANYDMTAATGGIDIAAVVIFFRGQTIAAGDLVERQINLFKLIPVSGGGQVDFEDTRVGRDAERSQARIGRGSVAFDPDWHFEVPARVFNSAYEVKIICEDRGVRQ